MEIERFVALPIKFTFIDNAKKDQNEDEEDDDKKAMILHCNSLQWLGKGTFSNVYKTKILGIESALCNDNTFGIDPQEVPPLNRWCAFKVLRCNDDKQLALLKSEVQMLSKLYHPNIVSCFGSWSLFKSNNISNTNDNDVVSTSTMKNNEKTLFGHCMVLEYCSGGDLEKLLKDRTYLSERETCLLFQQIRDALRYLLVEHQMLHRDIKPQNVLFLHPTHTIDHNTIVKLADFGFAKQLAHSTLDKMAAAEPPTMMQSIVGTPSHMACEIFMGKQYSDKSDLWSVGNMIYQCLTGKFAFRSHSIHDLSIEYRRGFVIPDFQDDWSESLKDLLRGLLKQDAQERIDWIDFFDHPWWKDPNALAFKAPPPPFIPSSSQQHPVMQKSKAIPIPVTKRRADNTTTTTTTSSPFAASPKQQSPYRYSSSSAQVSSEPTSAHLEIIRPSISVMMHDTEEQNEFVWIDNVDVPANNSELLRHSSAQQQQQQQQQIQFMQPITSTLKATLSAFAQFFGRPSFTETIIPSTTVKSRSSTTKKQSNLIVLDDQSLMITLWRNIERPCFLPTWKHREIAKWRIETYHIFVTLLGADLLHRNHATLECYRHAMDDLNLSSRLISKDIKSNNQKIVQLMIARIRHPSMGIPISKRKQYLSLLSRIEPLLKF